MCSSSKGGQDLKVKKIPTSVLNHSQLSDFVAIANAADARREERERIELEAQRQAQRLAIAAQEEKRHQKKRSNTDSAWDRLLVACHW